MAEKSTFQGKASTPIFWQSWLAPNPRACVVISHGMGEHGGRYAPFAKILVDLGFSVYAIDHRGHGHSGAPKGLISNFQYCVDDLDHLITAIVAPQKCPIILLGHSMGGAIATSYTLQHQDRLAALILSGAALNSDLVPGVMKLVCKFLGTLAPRLPVLKIDPSLVSRDPEQVTLYANDPLNMHGSVPVRTISEMVSTIVSMPSRFNEIRLPILILHGEQDQLIPAKSSSELHANISSTDKTLHIYPGLYHEVLNEIEADRQRVVGDISEWLLARFPSV